MGNNHRHFHDIMNQEVLIVASAGIYRERSLQTDTFPGVFRDYEQAFRFGSFLVPEAVTVGSWKARAGSFASFPQTAMNLAAPGAGIRCAGPKGQQYGDGTSFSTAMVSCINVVN